MGKRWILAFTILLSSCSVVNTASLGATLVLKPRIQAGAYTTKTTVSPYTQASINHLILKLFTYDGSEHDLGIQKSIPNAQLGNAITFANLKANTTYRIKAFAYSSSDESALISTSDANCYTDVSLTNSDCPNLAELKVKLIDIAFNGQATGSLQITNGGYALAGPEAMQFINQGVVSTLAGGAGGNTAGYLDGTGTAALLNWTVGVAVDGSGNLYVADAGNHLIRKITSTGVVSTFAGGAGGTIAGYADGTGTAAKFNSPWGIAVDGSGNVYVSDNTGKVIRKITSTGVVSTIAGTPGTGGYADGTAAKFWTPLGVAVDSSGNVYVADNGNHLIRKITSSGNVSTLAGTLQSAGYADGTGAAAKFNSPQGIAVDGSGNVYVAEYSGHLIRKVTSTGVVSTLAGTPGSNGHTDGTGTAAKFYGPTGVAVDGMGNLYVADQCNLCIRKITSNGVVSTLAGSSGGYTNGTGTAAKFLYPTGIAVDSAGNLYVADEDNSLIRSIK